MIIRMLRNSLVNLFNLFLLFTFVRYKKAKRNCVEAKDELPGYELVFIQTLWRHGDRGLNRTYPTDPNQEDAWRYGWQELTPKGMAEMEELGKIFRQRYIRERAFLNEQYTPKEIYVRSTDMNRILVSAQAVMAGLFNSERRGLDIPSKKESYTWPSHWIPVPVHAPLPFNKDPFVATFINCPRAVQIISELRNSSKYKRIADDNKEFLAYVSEKAGVSPPYTLSSVWRLFDSGWRERYNNMPQPDWFNETVFEHVKQLSLYIHPGYQVFAPWATSDEYFRLIGGPILKEIIDRSSLKFNCVEGKQNVCEQIVNDVQKIKDLKFYFYSAHQTTLASIAYTLNIQDQSLGVPNEEPPLSASFIFEFWAKKRTENNETLRETAPQMIRILYRKSIYANDYQTATSFVPGCNGSDFCSFEAFKQSREKYFPKDIEKECRMV